VYRLGRLRGLRSLGLGTVNREALAALAKLPLETLSFRVDEPDDLVVFGDCQRLKSISLSGRGIYDLRSLRRCAALERLSIPVAESYRNLDCIGYNSPLHSLSLGSTAVTDISELANARMLEQLSIFRSPVVDFAVLKILPKLSDLTLYRESRGVPWADLAQLRQVTLRNPDRQALVELSSISRPISLKIQSYGYEDIATVPRHLQSLEIWREEEEILDITGIEEFHNLQHFDASTCSVRGTKNLLNLPMLKSVWFYQSTGDFEDIVPTLRERGINVM
jgi:hypothetical protein